MKIEKILAGISSFCLIITFLVIISTPGAVGYEISIYGAYPFWFWFFPIAAYFCGLTILMKQAFDSEKSKYWLLGFAIVVIVNVVMLMLPEFRGYLFYGRGDSTTHLGRIKDILTTGHIGATNLYPIEHILGASLIQITYLPLESIPVFFSSLFYILYLLSVFIFAKSICKDFGQSLVIVAFASPLIYSSFNSSIHPALFSLFVFPFLLYFYQKRETTLRRKSVFTVLLLFFGIFLIFFHPTTSIFGLILFITFGLSKISQFHFFHRKTFVQLQNQAYKSLFRIFLLFVAVFFSWYFSFSSIQQSARAVYASLTSEASSSVISA